MLFVVLDDEMWIEASRSCDNSTGNLLNYDDGNRYTLHSKVDVVCTLIEIRPTPMIRYQVSYQIKCP